MAIKKSAGAKALASQHPHAASVFTTNPHLFALMRRCGTSDERLTLVRSLRETAIAILIEAATSLAERTSASADLTAQRQQRFVAMRMLVNGAGRRGGLLPWWSSVRMP